MKTPRSTHRASALSHTVPGLFPFLFAAIVGCATPKAPEPPPPPAEPNAPEVVAAEALVASDRLAEAISACVDISRKNPEARGLADLQQSINRRLADGRAESVAKRLGSASDLDVADAKRHGIVPDTYRKAQHVTGENAPLRTAPTAMQKVLSTPISVNLTNADINQVIRQIGESENINIIADSDISPKAVTINAKNTPLIEILEYVGRNLNVNFSVGDNLIWVTPKVEETSAVPLETRVYRLRKGMIGTELGKSAHGVSLFKGPEERGKSSSLTTKDEKKADKEGKVGLLEAIQVFVPQPEGADVLFNDKAHALVVKNTRENLALVEDLITAMDIRPLQILIEARFITTDISDLRQLGIEWLIDGSKGKSLIPDSSLLHSKSFKSVLNDTQTGASALNYQFLLDDVRLQAVLSALESSGKSRTIIVPRVTTLNNREANFRVGKDNSYFEEVQTSIMTSGSSTTSESRDNVTYDYDSPVVVETGYSLMVTPSVGSDLSTINLVLRPEISSIDSWEEYPLSSLASANSTTNKEPTLKLPILSRQYIETEAVVRSGETVVLGGLVDDSKSESQSGTPWLSTLPWVGNLFKVQEKKSESKNVLIFVTATLISDTGEDLIPLNQIERYGLAVPEESKIPDVLKVPAAAKPASPVTATVVPATTGVAPAAATPPPAAAGKPAVATIAPAVPAAAAKPTP